MTMVASEETTMKIMRGLVTILFANLLLQPDDLVVRLFDLPAFGDQQGQNESAHHCRNDVSC